MSAGLRRAPLAEALLEPRFQMFALAVVAALVLFARIGIGSMANFDDCYYAEKAREMLASGDWLTPRFSGMTRLDNPPLYLWLVAIDFKLMGQSDWAAIFPSALSGLLCVVLTHRLVRRLGGDTFTAFAAAAVLLTTSYFMKYAGHAMFDVFLTLLFVLAMLAYRRAWEGSVAAWLAVGALVGLGMLTKSVLGLFPLLVAGLHLLWSGRVRAALAGPTWLALLAALAVIAPWYGLQLRVNGELFLHEHVSWLLWERGFVIGREQQTLLSRFQYLREIATVYWPWLPFALVGAWGALRRAFARGPRAGTWDERDTARLMLAWIAVVVGIMSIGNEKKLWYVMSAFVPLAVLSAQAAAAWLPSDAARARTVHVSFALLGGIGLVLALTPWGEPPLRRPELQVVAHAARQLVPAGESILMPDGQFYSTAHQFVYYSHHRLTPPPADSAAVRAALDAGQWGLFTTLQRERFIGADSLRYPVVVASGKWALVHAGPRPAVPLEPTDAFE